MKNGRKQTAGRARLARRGRAAALGALLVLALFAGAAGAQALLIDAAQELPNTFTPGRVTCAVEETFDGRVKQDVRVENTGQRRRVHPRGAGDIPDRRGRRRGRRAGRARARVRARRGLGAA